MAYRYGCFKLLVTNQKERKKNCVQIDVMEQDYEYLKLYESKYGREEAMGLLEKTGVYMGPERYTLEHRPIDVLRGEVYNACRPS